MDIQHVIAKIAKLRALATSSNLNEAAAAAAAADRLMQEHSIAEAELEAAGEAPKEPVALADDPFAQWSERRVPQWQRKLAWRLIGHYDCIGIESNMRGRGGCVEVPAAFIRIIGRKSDIDAARYMYAYLTLEIERLAQLNRGNGRHWLDAFRHGAVFGCLEAMQASKSKVIKEARSTQSSAMVLIDSRKAEAQVELARLYPKRGKSHGVGQRGGSGFRAGRAAGKQLGT